MKIDLYGGPMDGDTVDWCGGYVYPGMNFNVLESPRPMAYYDHVKPDMSKPAVKVLHYRVTRVLRDVELALAIFVN